MYICKKCGELFDDIPYEITSRGYFNSYDDFELPEGKTILRCDCCGGKIVEAEQCIVCGEYVPLDEINSNICEDCLDEEAEASPYEYGLQIGADNKTDIYINGLIPCILSTEEIEKILLAYIDENNMKIDNFNKKCEKYCREDMSCFAQYVEDKHG